MPNVNHFISSVYLASLALTACSPTPNTPPSTFADTPSARLIKVLDQDGDGILTTTEARAASRRHIPLRALDPDKSGTVEESELSQVLSDYTPNLSDEYIRWQFHGKERVKAVKDKGRAPPRRPNASAP